MQKLCITALYLNFRSIGEKDMIMNTIEILYALCLVYAKLRKLFVQFCRCLPFELFLLYHLLVQYRHA
jgi:hypothetical protein